MSVQSTSSRINTLLLFSHEDAQEALILSKNGLHKKLLEVAKHIMESLGRVVFSSDEKQTAEKILRRATKYGKEDECAAFASALSKENPGLKARECNF